MFENVPQDYNDFVNEYKMRQAISPPTSPYDKYVEEVQKAPQVQDYHPSTMRRIGAGILGIGHGNYERGREFLYDPYYRQMQDYLSRTGGLGKAAEMQMKGNLTTEQINELRTRAQADVARQKEAESHGKLYEYQTSPEYNLGRYGYKPQTLDEAEELEGAKHPESTRPIGMGGSAIYDPIKGTFTRNPYYVPPERLSFEQRKKLAQIRGGRGGNKSLQPTQQLAAQKLAMQKALTAHPEYQRFFDQKTGRLVDPNDLSFWESSKSGDRALYQKMLRDIDIEYNRAAGSGFTIEGAPSSSKYSVEELDDEDNGDDE